MHQTMPQKIGDVLASRLPINDINVKKDRYINDTNVSNVNKNKYALDESKFTPNTEESMLAVEVATYFKDRNNFAFYMRLVKRLGVGGVKQLFAETKSDIAEKADTKTPVRSPAKYFVWKSKRRY